MDLSLTESQKMLKASAADFVKNEFPQRTITEFSKKNIGFAPEQWTSAAKLGWLGMVIPLAYGGGGASLTDAAVVFEELGRGPVPGPFFSSGVLSALTVLEGGTEAQKRELLPAIAQGEQIATLSITDANPFFGSDAITAEAVERNGEYLLQGTRPFVHDAMAANLFICAFRTGDSNDPEQNISLFPVAPEPPGVSVRPLQGFVGPIGEVTFDNVRVPKSKVLGELNAGWPALDRAMDKAIPVLCAYQVGGCQEVFDFTSEYTRTRVVFAQPIGRFQRVQDHVIDLSIHMDGARWATYEALWKLDSGRDARASVHLAKAVASEGYYEACNSSFEVHAGIGTDRNHPLVPHGMMSRMLYQYLGNPRYHKRIMLDAEDM